MLEDHAARFAQTYSAWRQRSARGEPNDDIEESLSRDFRLAWEGGDTRTRLDVLHYLATSVLHDGADIVWSAIALDDERVASVALHAATKYVRRLGIRPDAERVRVLRGIVQGDMSDSTRMTALDALEFAGNEGLDSWLQAVAEDDPSNRVRLRANITLTRRGSRQAAEAVLADLREHPDHFGVAEDLWDARPKVELTDEEERELRAVISRYVGWLQGKLGDRNEERDTRSMAATMLAKFRRDGFAIEAEDVDALQELTVSASRPEQRMGYLDLLAAFDMPEARQRIEDISRTDEAPEVREHARRLLT